MLKRTTSLLLALLMAASLAACESSAPTSSPTAAPTKAPEPDSEPESSEVSGFADRETIDLGLFQVSYPETWSYDEEDVKKENSWARVVFYEGESWDDAAVKELLDGIQLNLEDGDNVESPWPWEGEPFQPILSQQMVGTYTIVPEYIPFEEPQGVMDIMEHKFLQQGNQVFHLLNDTLDTYEYAEEGLKSVSTTVLDKECEYISSDNNGMLYLSTGLASEVVGVKDGQQVLKTTITEDLQLLDDGFLLLLATQKREDESANELMFFKLTGF